MHTLPVRARRTQLLRNLKRRDMFEWTECTTNKCLTCSLCVGRVLLFFTSDCDSALKVRILSFFCAQEPCYKSFALQNCAFRVLPRSHTHSHTQTNTHTQHTTHTHSHTHTHAHTHIHTLTHTRTHTHTHTHTHIHTHTQQAPIISVLPTAEFVKIPEEAWILPEGLPPASEWTYSSCCPEHGEGGSTRKRTIEEQEGKKERQSGKGLHWLGSVRMEGVLSTWAYTLK